MKGRAMAIALGESENSLFLLVRPREYAPDTG
jgi:hypothetical protein